MLGSFKLRSLNRAGLVWFATILASCTTPSPEMVKSPERLPSFSAESAFNEQPACKSMVDSYCHRLYSPDALGNLEIGNALTILQGETPNQFTQVFYRYAQAKIRNQRLLPKDFYQVLVRRDYFGKLRTLIDRRPRHQMTLFTRVQNEHLDYDVGSIWAASLNETVIARLDKKFPGFHKLPEKMVPMELSLERRRIRRVLISEISRAIWQDDQNWDKVERSFEVLKSSYLSMISRLDIPDAIRDDWTQRINEVRLVLPGSMPSISDEECSTTKVNAYYYRYLNVITVCAGDFNSEDIAQTLAHEMAHVLGIDRTQYIFANRSSFGRGLSKLRARVCQPTVFSCRDWEEFKSRFETDLETLAKYEPELPEFQRCLKRRETSKVLGDSDIERFARSTVSDRISQLASGDRFLRITKEKIPMRNGKLQLNPNYMNPCSYYLWSHGEEPIDDELTTLVFFTAEYRCSEGDTPRRLKSAIEVSKSMSQKVVSRSLRIEGEFSSDPQLEREGFASPNFERFADVIGSYAMAELLSRIPNIWERKNRFLASSSWQCPEPSIASHYPEESSIEQQYIFAEHTEGDDRRKEFLSQPIREVIGCRKDFEFNECKLPFKDPVILRGTRDKGGSDPHSARASDPSQKSTLALDLDSGSREFDP